MVIAWDSHGDDESAAGTLLLTRRDGGSASSGRRGASHGIHVIFEAKKGVSIDEQQVDPYHFVSRWYTQVACFKVAER